MLKNRGPCRGYGILTVTSSSLRDAAHRNSSGPLVGLDEVGTTEQVAAAAAPELQLA